MEMQHVEFLRVPVYLFELHDLTGQEPSGLRIKAERFVTSGNQPRIRQGVAAGKQRYIMALRYERLRQIRDDLLGPAVEPRQDALVERSDLSDLHNRYLDTVATHEASCR